MVLVHYNEICTRLTLASYVLHNSEQEGFSSNYKLSDEKD